MMNNNDEKQQNPGSERRRSFWPVQPSATHHNWFGYGMAALILATAFANMFLGGRIKNVMKAEMPKASWKSHQNFKESSESFAKASSKQHQTQYEHSTNNSKRQSYSSDDPKTTLLRDLAALHSSHLRTLGLKPTDYSEKAVKAAYRQLVLVYHPDRIAAEDPKREENLKKFQSISHSYQVLMDSLTKSR